MLIRFIKQITIFLILSKSFLKHLLLKRPNLMLRCDKVVDKNLIDSSLPFRKNFLRHKARNMLYLKYNYKKYIKHIYKYIHTYKYIYKWAFIEDFLL